MQVPQWKRRDFLSVLGGMAGAGPLAAAAQQAPSATPRIGILWPGASVPAPPRMESFRQGLSELGFVEGQNVAIELRYAKDGLQQLPALAAELVRLNVSVIQAFGDLAPQIARDATQTIPILAISDDIVGAGLIANLSRPGGNISGLTLLSPELSAKRLELLKEMVPGLSRVTALWDPTTGVSQVAMTEEGARSLNLQLQILEVRRREELGDVIRAARNSQTQALNVLSSPFLASLFREIISSAAEHHLPAIYQWREHVDAGGLVSYGPSLAAMFRQTAGLAVKILKGAKPADLPVEQPTKFELAINRQTANTLGLEIPPMLMARADDVVD
ncbi:MAG: ABC transporter substrate-binding protein [Xanthobacteraceae bacterium]